MAIKNRGQHLIEACDTETSGGFDRGGLNGDAGGRRWRWKRARGLCTWPAEVDQQLPLMGTS